jgi:thymidylate synthase (FAD)
MTLQSEVKGDNRYVPVLDHGFVGLIDHMGDDAAIVSAARVSYGDGTKSVREDRGLIRYLVRHKHTSPLEMAEVKLHLKLPIFVMRQLVRHRTSSLNEYSGRYSVLTNEMYVPELENILPQSQMNKQGRAGLLSEEDAIQAQRVIKSSCENSYGSYQTLLNQDSNGVQEVTLWDKVKKVFGGSEKTFSPDFPQDGVARELARITMPVAGYTELYWKQNLHNLFHMLKLRGDPHAQWEIQEFARAIYALVKPLYPAACEAYEDYIRDAKTLSGMELMRALVTRSNEFDLSFSEAFDHIQAQFTTEEEFLNRFRMSKRELIEFKNTLKL